MSIARSLFLVGLLIATFEAYAQETKVDRAIRAVKELCLAGTQFDLKVDAKGNLSFRKLAPGAEGSFSVNVRESAGAAAIIDDKIRQVADEDIRQCVKPHITRIVDAILDEKPTEAKKTSARPIPIELQASRFVHGERVAMASGIVARYGADVLMNAPPYERGPNAAEFEVRPTAPGSYRFGVRYASADSRPVTVSLNGRTINANALAAPTGCFDPNCQKWMEQGEVSLNDGLNIVRLQTNGVFPHITALRFIPVQ
jgi:hypothetical protein